MVETQIRRMMECVRWFEDNLPGSWQEKRDAVVAAIEAEDVIAFEEFLSWFDGTSLPDGV